MDYKQPKVVFNTEKHIQNGFQNYNYFHCFRSRNFPMCFFSHLNAIIVSPISLLSQKPTFYQWQNHQSSFLRIKVEERTLHQHGSEYEPLYYETQLGYAGKFLTLYLMNLHISFH